MTPKEYFEEIDRDVESLGIAALLDPSDKAIQKKEVQPGRTKTVPGTDPEETPGSEPGETSLVPGITPGSNALQDKTKQTVEDEAEQFGLAIFKGCSIVTIVIFSIIILVQVL